METKNKKKGRPTTAQITRNIINYCEQRAKGYSQQESGNIIGVNDNTARRYERIRLDKVQWKHDIIALLEAKAKHENTTAKDLVILTKEITRLREMVANCN